MSDTATPYAARDHARSLGQTVVENMPRLPIHTAEDIPSDLNPKHLVWDETLAAGGYTAHTLERGMRLRLMNTQGDANVSFLVYNADNPVERLNIADTVKVQWNGYLKQNKLLLSDMGRVLMSMTKDTCGQHDTFCGISSAATNAKRYATKNISEDINHQTTCGQNYSNCPNARDRFLIALTKLGLGKKDICPSINFFKHVKIQPDGSTQFIEKSSQPGDIVELRAEMRCLVVLTNCPHVLDPRPTYTATPVRVLAYQGPMTAADDPVRQETPEGQRAFENVDHYYHYAK